MKNDLRVLLACILTLPWFAQDTIQRPAGESQMKEFHPLKLGVVRLEKSPGLLTSRAVDIHGRNVINLRQIDLILRP